MALDVLHRLRWRNLGRAVAAVIVVVAVVAWPRFGAPQPRLPGSAAVPLVEPAPPRVVEAAPPMVRERPKRRGKRARRRARRPVHPRRQPAKRRPRREGVARQASPPRTVAQAPVARPPAVVPSVDPVQEEFGIEGG
jgi:hypothetical protein